MNDPRIFEIQGMHCGSCVARITEAVKANPSVRTVTVDLAAGQMEVRAEASLSDASISQIVASAGAYTAQTIAVANPSTPAAEPEPRSFWATYRPLFTLVALLALVPAVSLGESLSAHSWMRWFMAGFFLSFSYFKLLDIKSFADSYRMYDWIAKVVPAWGLAYPFVELGLGLAYAADLVPTATNWITLVLMLVGAGGVIQSNLQKKSIRCACLGTVFNLPMSTVTILEDLSMAAMAAWMLV
ncbi:MAG: heavy metal translocating P-type ATPase [Cryomorphaceae bacterium]|nr:heavy metal translocating P-type ATPase [Cryomorphaceae bacterium]